MINSAERLHRVRGTHDWLDMRLFDFFITTAQRHFELYHFHHIMTPILEQAALFKRSLGLQTDVVSKEMFLIAKNDAHAEELCLRPEATASTMRAFLERGSTDNATPWKTFLYGPMFRYERPQKGRYRQFHQISIEAIGTQALTDDVQMIAMLDRLFAEQLQLDNYALMLNFLGCSSDRTQFKETLKKFLEKHTEIICSTCQVRKEKNILRIFDCKTETCAALYRTAPAITDSLCAACQTEWQTICHDLEHLSVSFSHEPRLVRGLDYYDKVVFEFSSDQLGAQSAFCGGGRYNGLAQQLGAEREIPSVGAALGIERVLLLLESIQDRLILPQAPPLHLIIPMGVEQQTLALLTADHLRAYNVCVDIAQLGSMKQMMRQADKAGARTVIILGSDEMQAGTATVKNMLTGIQEVLAQTELVNFLKNK